MVSAALALREFSFGKELALTADGAWYKALVSASDTSRDTFRAWVTQDWDANAGFRDTKVILAWFRMTQWGLRRWGAVGRAMNVVFYLVSRNILALELAPGGEIGPGLWLPHPHNIHVNVKARIGRNCYIGQGVSVGTAIDLDGHETPSPVVGDHVQLGAGCVVVGNITLGDYSRIGANAVVTSDVPAHASALGNPARILRSDAT